MMLVDITVIVREYLALLKLLIRATLNKRKWLIGKRLMQLKKEK